MNLSDAHFFARCRIPHCAHISRWLR